jgi:NAD-dependent DNA ligase
MERRRAQEWVGKNGGVNASGVSKTLDYLVVGDGGGAGTKLTKAKKIIADGATLTVLSESDFLKLIKNV